MAVTQITDVVVPQEFTTYTVENSVVSNAFSDTGVLVPNGVISNAIVDQSYTNGTVSEEISQIKYCAAA